MAGVITEDYEASSGRSCQSGDSIAEWRSSDQVENGTPSTSPLYWDTDDDDCGPKPSELFRRFTWKIDNFSTINRRELRSNAFEVCGYKWYILIYPQGCDVCNHLSLFLCVANHDKLLPGWGHFAQFTIAVINKDPKKTKYSDTLHRFWRKEHDWGWKKFMELSKVYDGFVNSDTLVIKAQVQVIREKAHRPFRCLECQYRRELVRVYLSNVEQICRHFIDEKTGTLSKLVEDKNNWLRFRSFWLGIDPNSRQRMSRDKTDVILKVVVKQFFIEKEVTSTLVMDSLYSGLKVLECQSKNNAGGAKFLDLEKLPSPIVCIDEDMFVLADDVLLLLEKTVREPLPHQPLPLKDDKYAQNRTKDGNSGEEFSKDTIERDERRLMELGRRTIEIFVLFHIFSTIQIAYQEAVALTKQEELIREEEAACHAENELRAKRGGSEKDKRLKKKQAKQKRNSRKGKDKVKNDLSNAMQELSHGGQSDSLLGEYISEEVESVVEQINILEDASDVSDNGNVAEVLQPDLDDRDAIPVSWDTDTSEVILSTEVSGSDITSTQLEKRIQSALDDSSSTCSTDSVPSVVMDGPYKRSSWANNKFQSSPNRGENNQNREAHDKTGARKFSSTTLDAPPDSLLDVAAYKTSQPESDAIELPLKVENQRIQKHTVEKDVEVTSIQKVLVSKDLVDSEVLCKPRKRESPSASLVGMPNINAQQAKQSLEAPSSIAVSLTSSATKLPPTRDSQTSSLHPRYPKLPPLESKLLRDLSTPKSATQNNNPPGKNLGNQAISGSRSPSAPIVPAQSPRSVAPAVNSMPLLSCHAVKSPSSNYVPQSYRNAIIGKPAIVTSATSLGHQTASSNQSITCSQSHPSTFMASPTVPPPSTSVSTDQTLVRQGFTFGFSKQDVLNNSWQLSRGDANAEAASSEKYSLGLEADIERLRVCGGQNRFSSEISSQSLQYQAQGVSGDEFPHLDIINDLLDEESNGSTSKNLNHKLQHSLPHNNSLMDFASYSMVGQFEHLDQHYDDIFQSAYASSRNPYQGFQNGHLSQHPSQPDLWPYGQYFDLSYQNWGNGDSSGYTYPLSDYSSLLSGVNGYMYRPTSGP